MLKVFIESTTPLSKDGLSQPFVESFGGIWQEFLRNHFFEPDNVRIENNMSEEAWSRAVRNVHNEDASAWKAVIYIKKVPE